MSEVGKKVCWFFSVVKPWQTKHRNMFWVETRKYFLDFKLAKLNRLVKLKIIFRELAIQCLQNSAFTLKLNCIIKYFLWINWADFERPYENTKENIFGLVRATGKIPDKQVRRRAWIKAKALQFHPSLLVSRFVEMSVLFLDLKTTENYCHSKTGNCSFRKYLIFILLNSTPPII